MPSPETKDKYQRAVIWPVSSRVTRYAESQIGDPEEVSVRWRNTRRDMLDRDGNRITVEAVVELNQEVAVGSLMWLGELDDWMATGSAVTDTRIMEVVSSNPVPDLKNRFTEYSVSLKRYKNTLAERE